MIVPVFNTNPLFWHRPCSAEGYLVSGSCGLAPVPKHWSGICWGPSLKQFDFSVNIGRSNSGNALHQSLQTKGNASAPEGSLALSSHPARASHRPRPLPLHRLAAACQNFSQFSIYLTSYSTSAPFTFPPVCGGGRRRYLLTAAGLE